MKKYEEFVNYFKDMAVVTGGLVGNVIPDKTFLLNLENVTGLSPYNVPNEIWENFRNEDYWNCTGLTEAGIDGLIDRYDDYDLFTGIVIILSTYPADAKCYEEHYLDLKFQGCSEEWINGYYAGGGFKGYHEPNKEFGEWLSEMYKLYNYWEDGEGVY